MPAGSTAIRVRVRVRVRARVRMRVRARVRVRDTSLLLVLLLAQLSTQHNSYAINIVGFTATNVCFTRQMDYLLY